ncbi:hypothetical protein WMY93_002267 [Mugilogobius chulae]|uniref:Ig-like domain-containing protein n=1 Tax=Mugilogobius chulae TaxID=88201 RepID=A0AAW0PZ59_9GOBI
MYILFGKTKPVSFLTPLRDTSFSLGQPLALDCSFSGSQRIYVSWTKDDKPIWASYKYNVKTSASSCRLEVLNSDREEAQGKYSVTVSNSCSSVTPTLLSCVESQRESRKERYRTQKLLLHTTHTTRDAFVMCRVAKREAPHFVRKLENTTYRLGEALSLRVAFRASERVSVSWRKDGRPIWASYKYNVKTTDCSCVLEVLNADREEARGATAAKSATGTELTPATAINRDGTDSCHAHVTLGNTLTTRFNTLYHYNNTQTPNYSCEISNRDGSDACHAHVTLGNTLTTRFNALYHYNNTQTPNYSCEISNRDGSDSCHDHVTLARGSGDRGEKLPAPAVSSSALSGLHACYELPDESQHAAEREHVTQWTDFETYHLRQ